MKQPWYPQHLIACILLTCGMAAMAHADTVIVTADRMIDVLAGRVVDHPQITIVDGRITAVATRGSAAPAGARRVDLEGMTLLPGLIDMHTHLTSDPRYGGYRRLEFTDNFWTVVGVANAKKTLEAGFTTIRNVGSRNFDAQDPLADVTGLQTVAFVMKGGDIVKAPSR
jgi:imidazolonepropionase-like amidohydrolase